eukprot:CAMPEP_0198140252 /NCGR_PEP_ID=MMETSP1443-20131203/3449_1 /TAXON_ID=186043 /ORGANISM="Entomoneis sp., Strain CCMP2396" /LENGTH=265 /DNA_ID=CAMNT_0043802625 /DNA_START=233 /DNA_END=1030 /DNA_ORIENTATION=-
MGCMQSFAVAKSSVEKQGENGDFTEDDNKAITTASQISSKKPRPLIFAIMRNGHEVIRGAERDLKELIEKGDLEGAAELWEKHKRWMFVHMKMEDGTETEGSPMGMFKLLDQKFEGIASDAGLNGLHVKLHELEGAVDQAFQNKDLEKLQQVFPEYDSVNLDHLVKEEEIMMPKVMEMKKNGVDLKTVIVEEVLAAVVDLPDFEFFIKFGNEILEKHHQGQPRARVWDHALWAVATEEQWVVWDAWIKESLWPEPYEEVQVAIHW